MRLQSTNGCSSNLLAVGLSAGFRRKQHCKKSLPSGDSVSGMGGLSFKTLNNAAALNTQYSFRKSVRHTKLEPHKMLLTPS